ncbi:hypothetical protein A4X13_0g8896 [Tilletia indica]|uniref:Uncharacterized protein n=1 Tax=Tilletia indica TaxID=43049 RepID=A0A177SZ60_9BASI|nr:hypothetical protein A4X13_0g8896 [Tilletia indica]
MAPRKRKDIVQDEATDSGSQLALSAAEGQGQPIGSYAGSLAAEPEAEDQTQADGSHANTIRQDDDLVDFTPRSSNLKPEDDDCSSEELELVLEAIELQLKINQIRQAILKKKPQGNPQEKIFVSQSQRQAQIEIKQVENDSVLRERQNDRLRRAGLLPPRVSEVRPSATPPAMRQQSSPPAALLSGIDRKVTGIMTSADQSGLPTTNERSEISRAGIKVPAPEKWKGERSLQVFTDWTHSLAHYFKVHSPLSELLKVNLIGGYLIGDPLDWYWRHVAPTAAQWTATDVVVALRRQFLVDELSRQAADKFESAEQGSQDVHEFQAYLLKMADQMAEYPSPVALNRRLLKGMNSNIKSAIIANRGIDAEISPWEDIVQTAMDQERAQRYALASNRDDSSDREKRKDPNDSRFLDTSKSSEDREERKYPRESPGTLQSAPVPDSITPIPRTAVTKLSSGLFRPPLISSGPRQPFLPGIKPSGPRPTDQCRACGAFGHWASDCPKRLRANLVDIDKDTQGTYDHNTNTDEDEEPSLVYFDTEDYFDSVGDAPSAEHATRR